MAFDTLLFDVQGPLALVTLNRPERLNAVSLQMMQELHLVLDECLRRDEVRAVALTGAGSAFSAGSDLNEVEHRSLHDALMPLVQGVAERLQRIHKPTIAAVNGTCYGGGLELALGCDLRIATTNATFATPEGRLGIIPGGGATQRLPRIVGRAMGMDMLLLGEPIDAERALQVGLVTRLVSPSELMSSVAKMAERLSSYAPLVPQFMKAMVNAGLEASLPAGLALEKFAQSALCATEDKAEGIRAFLEKREPKFSGR